MMEIFTADLHRIFFRKPRLLIAGAAAAVCVMSCLLAKNDISTLKMMSFGLDVFFPLALAALGLLDFVYVFADDVDSHAYVAVIGQGMKRGRFAAMKLLEAVTVFTADVLLFNGLVLLLIGTGLLNTAFMSPEMWMTMNVCAWIKIVISMFAGSVFVFGNGSMIAASVAFLAVNSGVAEGLFSHVFRLPLIANLHLDSWMPGMLTSTFSSKLYLGMTDWAAAGVLIGFVIVLGAAAIAAFKFRELEF